MATIYTDGSCLCNPGPTGCAAVFVDGSDQVFYDSDFLGEGTNNTAEYGGILMGLRLGILHAPAEGFVLCSDSKLALAQIQGQWATNKPELKGLRDLVLQTVEAHPGTITFKHVRAHRGNPWNELADSLAKEAAGYIVAPETTTEPC